MSSKKEAALLKSLRAVLPKEISVEAVLSEIIEAEKRAGPEFADPRTWDEVAVLRLVEKQGVAVLASPSVRRAIVRLIEERRRTTSPRRQDAIDPALKALVRTLIPHRPPRMASTLDSRRADRVWQIRRAGKKRSEAIEQVTHEEKGATPEAVEQSLKRHRRKVRKELARERQD